MSEKTILILGATSAIAKSCAHLFAIRGYHLILAGRDTEELKRIAADLIIRYHIQAQIKLFDANDQTHHADFFYSVIQDCHQIDGVLLAFGYLGDQDLANQHIEESLNIISQNYTGAVSILQICAAYFERQEHGFIVGISSVAGDRGRQSNYLYGSAKAGLSVYLAGLRNRLQRKNICVLTVKPGFVDTVMTFGLPGVFLAASPNFIAKKIIRAIDKRRSNIYTPWFWRYIMLILKIIPEPIFKRLNL